MSAITKETTAASVEFWKFWTCKEFINALEVMPKVGFCKMELQKVCINRRISDIERVIESSFVFDKPSMCQKAVDWLQNQSENSTCKLELHKDCIASIAIPAPLCAPNEMYAFGSCRITLPSQRSKK